MSYQLECWAPLLGHQRVNQVHPLWDILQNTSSKGLPAEIWNATKNLQGAMCPWVTEGVVILYFCFITMPNLVPLGSVALPDGPKTLTSTTENNFCTDINDTYKPHIRFHTKLHPAYFITGLYVVLQNTTPLLLTSILSLTSRHLNISLIQWSSFCIKLRIYSPKCINLARKMAAEIMPL